MNHTTLVVVLVIIIIFVFLMLVTRPNKEESLFPERVRVRLLTGKDVVFRNLDNAASTQSFKCVMNKINEFTPYYSGVHRGSGYLSQLSTKIFDECREVILGFVGAKPGDTCIYGKNASECINKLSAYCAIERKKKVIITRQEHHSNIIPWKKMDYVVCDVDHNGVLDLADLERKLGGDDVLLVSVTGASNVTGIINPISEISEIAHRHGAMLHVDGAQLVPHRPVNMLASGIDFLSFSAHKMYAPFGTGVLVGPKDFFNTKEPFLVGGGEVEHVSLGDNNVQKIIWKETPDKDEEGSPNVIGVLALAESIRMLTKIGRDIVSIYEDRLTSITMKGLKSIHGVDVISYCDDCVRNVGIVTFQVSGMHYAQVGAILNYEFGIGCRAGCFCAGPYVTSLLGLTESCVLRNIDSLLDHGDKTGFGGMIRFSLGLGVTEEDVRYAIDAVKQIAKRNYVLHYEQLQNGEFIPVKDQYGNPIDISSFQKAQFDHDFKL